MEKLLQALELFVQIFRFFAFVLVIVCVFYGGGSLGPISLSRLWDLHAELPVALMSYLHKFPGQSMAT